MGRAEGCKEGLRPFVQQFGQVNPRGQGQGAEAQRGAATEDSRNQQEPHPESAPAHILRGGRGLAGIQKVLPIVNGGRTSPTQNPDGPAEGALKSRGSKPGQLEAPFPAGNGQEGPRDGSIMEQSAGHSGEGTAGGQQRREGPGQ